MTEQYHQKKMQMECSMNGSIANNLFEFDDISFSKIKTP